MKLIKSPFFGLTERVQFLKIMKEFVRGNQRSVAHYKANEQLLLDEASEQISRLNTELSTLTESPRITLILILDRARVDLFYEALCSLKNQNYKNWELMVIKSLGTYSNELQECYCVLENAAQKDTRIKWISGNLTEAYSLAITHAQGAWIMRMGEEDVLAPHALACLVVSIHHQQKVNWIFSDEDLIDQHGQRSNPYLKPEWDTKLLLRMNYMGGFLAARRECLEDAFMPIANFNEELGAWHLALLRSGIMQSNEVVLHIDKILYHRRKLATSLHFETLCVFYANQDSLFYLNQFLLEDKRGVAAHYDPVMGQYLLGSEKLSAFPIWRSFTAPSFVPYAQIKLYEVSVVGDRIYVTGLLSSRKPVLSIGLVGGKKVMWRLEKDPQDLFARNGIYPFSVVFHVESLVPNQLFSRELLKINYVEMS